MVTILATILIISVPNYFSPTGIFTWLTCWRILVRSLPRALPVCRS